MIRRTLAALAIALLSVAGLAVAPAAAQAGFPAQQQLGDDDNQAIAVNTEDGASVFRLAFSVRYVTDGVVDQTNTAVALARCTDCRTVALAFQVVLVEGDADVVVPENRALALNVECTQCLTYASATQIMLGVDGRVRFTGEGQRRLAMMRRDLQELERTIDTIDPNALLAEVSRLEQELLAILDTELVPVGPPEGDDGSSTTSTTSVDDGEGDAETTTTTVEDEDATTTTTEEPSTTTTTAVEAEPTTTTTAAA